MMFWPPLYFTVSTIWRLFCFVLFAFCFLFCFGLFIYYLPRPRAWNLLLLAVAKAKAYDNYVCNNSHGLINTLACVREKELCVCVRLSINIYVMCCRHSCFLRRRATHTFRKQNFVSDADFVSSFEFSRVSPRRLPCFHFCLSCFVFCLCCLL